MRVVGIALKKGPRKNYLVYRTLTERYISHLERGRYRDKKLRTRGLSERSVGDYRNSSVDVEVKE